ncbi:MAG: hypothetical protein ACRDJY_09830 [Thermoleophilaceae bacterium]
MPVIIVRPDNSEGVREEFTLSENVIPSALHDDHYLSQLIQRLGWALVDAEDLETAGKPSVLDVHVEASGS